MNTANAVVVPSARQLEFFDQRDARRPVVLVYQYDCAAGSLRAPLQLAAAAHGARLVWSGSAEQALIGSIGERRHVHLLHFKERAQARAWMTGVAQAHVLAAADNLLVCAVSAPPRMLPLIAGLLARLMPRLPFDRSLEDGDEPGVGVRGHMPTHAAMEAFLAHPQQQTPVTMINWIKFREAASYDGGGPSISGRDAYLRYGRVAVPTVHHLGGRLLAVGRYQQVLVGNAGDPASSLWDEFALMQYPSRAVFKFMASMKRYRAALADRDAGLVDKGQGLAIAKPDPDCVWRR